MDVNEARKLVRAAEKNHQARKEKDSARELERIFFEIQHECGNEKFEITTSANSVTAQKLRTLGFSVKNSMLTPGHIVSWAE
jgi:hypothetical protein